jgi:hypothetical protein
MATDIALIWVSEKQKYFSCGGWTALLQNSPTGKSAARRAVRIGGQTPRART